MQATHRHNRFKLSRGIAAYDFHDHYAILGLPLNTSSDQIRKRYLQIAKTLHPDVCKHADSERAVELLSKLVNPSYNLLTQERERTEYEAILKLLAKRLMKRKESLRPSCPPAQKLLAQPSTKNYLIAVQEIAQVQYADLDRVIERTEQLSELNLVYVLSQEGYQPSQSAPASEADTIVQGASAPTTPSADQLIRQAEQHLADKEWTMALRHLRSAIQLDATNSKAHALLGLVYMHQKLNGMAKISFQQALKYNPNEPIAKENLPKVAASSPEKDKNKKGGFFGWLGGG
ncbi:MAG: DnaJ domain-containing protein [Pseudanabaenaceae cyanobacterium]